MTVLNPASNEARIAKARDRFRARRRSGPRPGSGPQRRPPRKRINGRPMVLNKKGVYVLDQKKLRQQKRKIYVEAALAALRNQDPAPAPPPSPAPTPQANVGTSVDPVPSTTKTVRPTTIQEILRGLL